MSTLFELRAADDEEWQMYKSSARDLASFGRSLGPDILFLRIKMKKRDTINGPNVELCYLQVTFQAESTGL